MQKYEYFQFKENISGNKLNIFLFFLNTIEMLNIFCTEIRTNLMKKNHKIIRIF